MYPKERVRRDILITKMPNGCHICISHSVDNSIGYIYSPSRKSRSMHRYVYEKVNGRISKNMCVMHTCDDKRCINPKHLIIGTNEDNRLDMMNKNRNAKGEATKSNKLTEKQIKSIRNSKEKNNILAKRFRVSTTNIRYIKARKTWRCVK